MEIFYQLILPDKVYICYCFQVSFELNKRGKYWFPIYEKPQFEHHHKYNNSPCSSTNGKKYAHQ